MSTRSQAGQILFALFSKGHALNSAASRKSSALQESRQAPVNVNTLSGRADSVCAVFQRPRLEFCSVAQIERRPRGVSRMNPLLRSVATCHCLAGLGCPPWCLALDKWGAEPAERKDHAIIVGVGLPAKGHALATQVFLNVPRP